MYVLEEANADGVLCEVEDETAGKDQEAGNRDEGGSFAKWSEVMNMLRASRILDNSIWEAFLSTFRKGSRGVCSISDTETSST